MKIHETVMLTLQNFRTFHELFKEAKILITIASKATYFSYNKIKVITIATGLKFTNLQRKLSKICFKKKNVKFLYS